MSRGSVPADIESIVNDLKSITLEQVIFEAVTNSIQANATEIKIKFTNQNEADFKDIKKYIDNLIIEDNGDGFTSDNTKSFEKYRSTYKRNDHGAKGIGRFLFLKIFQTINIESLDKKITFVKDKDIDVKNLEQNEFEKTTIYFKNPINNFSVDYENLEQKIQDHFLAYFKLLKEKENRKIVIKIFENKDERIVITNDNILKFKTTNFKIHDHEFILDYVLNDENIKENEGFYCAGNRVVIKNSNLDSTKKLKVFANIRISYLLISKYLDNNVNDSRDDFTIMPILTQNKLFHDLSWKDIQSKISNQIKKIAIKNNIDINEIANENLNKSRLKAPYLAHYLQNNENSYCSEDLIENAIKQLIKDKKIIRDSKSKIDNSYQEKIGIVTQTELAEYIYDRQRIIDKLKELTDNNALEKEIHNLFMKQRTTDTKQNYKSNNLWLFDDRFMLYDKVFSEKDIKDIFPELSNNINRPDILSIVSNTYDKDNITDIVVIELKKPDTNITTEGAEAQLLKYSRFINQANIKNKVRIWTYAFLKFNNEVGDDLDDKDYNKIPTQYTYPIYYKYHEKRNTIINFMDYRSLAFDADNRNKTFMKILDGDTQENKKL